MWINVEYKNLIMFMYIRVYRVNLGVFWKYIDRNGIMIIICYNDCIYWERVGDK